MADEPQNAPRHPGDAWLEEALLLAAAEIAAFRAIAQGERERMREAEEAARARAHGLEEELRRREAAHERELAALRTQVDGQLGEREKAWAQFSVGLGERLTLLASAQAQHAQDVEEAGALRRQLHAARSVAETAEEKRGALEKRLLANEEDFARAAGELQQKRDEASAQTAKLEELTRELDARTAKQNELQANADAQAAKVAEADVLRARLEDELRLLAIQLRDVRTERDQLATHSLELSELRVAHVELEVRAKAQTEELATQKLQLAELSHVSRDLDALRALHGEVELRADKLRGELVDAQARANELASSRDALNDLRIEHVRVGRELADANTARQSAEAERDARARTLEEQQTEHQSALTALRDAQQAARDVHEQALQEARSELDRVQQEARTERERSLETLRAELERIRQAERDASSQAFAEQRAELSEVKERLVDLDRISEEFNGLRGDHEQLLHERRQLQNERSELQSQLTRVSADYAEQRAAYEALRTEAQTWQDTLTQLEAAQAAQRDELEGYQDAQRRQLQEAEQRAADAVRGQDIARARMQEAEADVAAARRERDQVRAASDARLGELAAADARLAELTSLEQQLVDARAEIDEQSQTRWALLDIEKQRSAKLKAELDLLRSQLGLGARGHSIPPDEDAWQRVTDRPSAHAPTVPPPGAAGELPLGSPEHALESLLPPMLGPVTVPLKDFKPANQVAPTVPPARPREGTSYSYTELGEEQIVVPQRLPQTGKGSPGGGRGGR